VNVSFFLLLGKEKRKIFTLFHPPRGEGKMLLEWDLTTHVSHEEVERWQKLQSEEEKEGTMREVLRVAKTRKRREKGERR